MSKYAQELKSTVKEMIVLGKGLLAMEESNGTHNKKIQK